MADAVAGAGAIRSTAGDMLTYLELQPHPNQAMQAAIQSTHELHADALPGMKIGHAWLFIPKIDSYCHNGATGGYSSYALFSPTEITLYLFCATTQSRMKAVSLTAWASTWPSESAAGPLCFCSKGVQDLLTLKL